LRLAAVPERALDPRDELAVHPEQALARVVAVSLVAGLRRRALAAQMRLKATVSLRCSA